MFPLPHDNLYPNGTIRSLADGVMALFHNSDTTLELVPLPSDGTELAPTYVEGTVPFLPSTASLPERNALALCLLGPSGISVTLVSNTGQVIGDPIPVDDEPDVLLCDLAWSGRELLVVWRHVTGDGTGLADVMAKVVAVP
jgi:hypothetical protein